MRASYKKIVISVLRVFAFWIFLLACFLWLPKFYNNILTNTFAQSLVNVRLPEKSAVIDVQTRFGNLWGMSDKCNVEVISVVRSELSKEDFGAKFDKSQENDLSYPYSPDRDYMSVYYFDGKKLYEYFIANDQSGKYFEVNSDSGIAYMDTQDIVYMYNLLDKYKNSEQNIYVLTATDTTFVGLAVNDFRCM